MAHITDLVAPHFTGHVGPVRFVNGHAETDDPELVAYFGQQDDRYVVTETDEPPTYGPERNPDDPQE